MDNQEPDPNDSRPAVNIAGVRGNLPGTGPLLPAHLPTLDTESATSWFWETDLEGRCVFCSPEVERLLGLRVDQVVGKPLASLGLTEEASTALAQALRARREIHDLRFDGHTKSGKPITLQVNAVLRTDPSGAVTGFRGGARVFERRDRGGAPSPTHIRIPRAIEPPPAPPVPPRRWSEAAGYVADGLGSRPIPRNDPDAVPPDPSALVLPILAQDTLLGVLELGEHESGRPWTEDDRLLAEAAVQQLALALHDARSYQLTQRALDEMREADRLKTQFLANMSHELRTPLNSIIGFSRVILKGIDGPINETQAQDLSAIYNSGQHLLGLINDILDLSRIEAGKMELAFTEVDLGEIIRSVMSTAAGLVKDKPIELMLDVPPTLPIIQADNIRIRQVLLNLISNATKFTERGQVGVRAKVVSENGKREVIVSVFDTGPGIAPEHQDKLFEPFSQVDASPTRKTGGSGLGLSICRHLIELHEGRIWVESKAGEGSTFSFAIPVGEVPPLPLAERPPEPLILAVEEDPAVLGAYRQHLEGSGSRLHAVMRATEAAPLARELRPAGMIVDPHLVDLDSWQLLAGLRAYPDTRAIPVILAGRSREAGGGFHLRPVDWTAKPFQPADLLPALARLVPAGRHPAEVLGVCADASEAEALRGLLEGRPEYRARVASDGAGATEALNLQKPDIVVLDLSTPDLEAFGALERMRGPAALGPLPILFLWSAPASPTQAEVMKRRIDVLTAHSALPEADWLTGLRTWIGAAAQRAAARA
jgi:PAS domain S-box-containing protein